MFMNQLFVTKLSEVQIQFKKIVTYWNWFCVLTLYVVLRQNTSLHFKKNKERGQAAVCLSEMLYISKKEALLFAGATNFQFEIKKCKLYS